MPAGVTSFKVGDTDNSKDLLTSLIETLNITQQIVIFFALDLFWSGNIQSIQYWLGVMNEVT